MTVVNFEVLSLLHMKDKNCRAQVRSLLPSERVLCRSPHRFTARTRAATMGRITTDIAAVIANADNLPPRESLPNISIWDAFLPKRRNPVLKEKVRHKNR